MMKCTCFVILETNPAAVGLQSSKHIVWIRSSFKVLTSTKARGDCARDIDFCEAEIISFFDEWLQILLHKMHLIQKKKKKKKMCIRANAGTLELCGNDSKDTDKMISVNQIIKLLMMLLMSCCDLANGIKSTVLIEVTTLNVGYAKSLLQAGLKYQLLKWSFIA